MADRLSTPTATLIGTTLLSLATGYIFGHLIGNPFAAAAPPAPKSRADTSHYDDEEESSEEEIDDGIIIDHAPNWANGAEADRREGLRASARAAEEGGVTADWDLGEECKMVLVVRTDLGMTKGKMAAQCGHATLAAYKTSLKTGNPALRRWERQGQAKVALQVRDEQEMLLLMAKARSLGIVAEVIQDAGRTQIASGSYTVLGVGPAPKSVVDKVTGHLKLL